MKLLSISSLAFLAVGTAMANDAQINVYDDADYKGASAVVKFNDGDCASWPSLQNRLTSFFATDNRPGACLMFTTSNCSNNPSFSFSFTNGYYANPNVGSQNNDKLNSIKCYARAGSK